MKWIWIFLCLPAFGQLPVLPFAPPVSSATTATLALWVQSTSFVSNSTGTAFPPADTQSSGGWGDLSGSGHHLSQSQAGTQPTYHATGGGGNNSPYLAFASSWFTNQMASFSYSQTNTLIAAINDHQPNASQWIIDAGPNEEWYAIWGGPLVYHVNAGVDFNPATPNPFMSGNAWHVVTIQFSGANSFVRIDGTNVVNWTGNAGTGTATRFDIGKAYNGTLPSIIDVMEVRFYNGFMGATTIHPIEQTMGTTWSIVIH